ncbi:MAG: adenylosuccinate synthase [Lewinellaceae bacterium]|nr:adenylosuccinate synthase [Lewinellaceae bacterium]
MGVDVILGLQWGDEGKGKIVDFLANQYDIVCRFQGGPNAGHTIKLGENKYVLHTVPSGVFRAGIINVIGNGVVLDPITFVKELANLDTANVEYKNRLLIAKKAHFILPTHRYLDAASEAAKGSSKIGSTLKGIGPTYMDKTGRNGLRVGDIFSPHFFDKYKQLKEKHLGLLKLYPEIEFNLDREEALWFESIGQIKSLQFIDSEYYLNEALNNGKRLLAEGAQGSMLDVDFGTYPFVTSSNTTVSGVCNGLGISPQKIDKVIGIAKAYCTRVGSGPFPSELDNEVGEQLRQKGFEFGATTGRPRRCGWLDIPQLRYSVMVNGVTDLIITKMDVLDGFEKVEMVTSYKDINGAMTDKIPFDIVDRKIETVTTAFKGWQDELSKVQSYAEFPEVAKDYLAEISQRTGTRVSMVSTGPEREKLFKILS